MKFTFRSSEFTDFKKVADLIHQCFGALDRNVMRPLDGRYLLAFDEEKLAGLVSYPRKDVFIYKDIDLICVSPAYRKQGLAAQLLERVVADLDYTVCISCWRTRGRELPDVHNALVQAGFHLWHKSISYTARTDEICNDCPHRTDTCECYDDLYIREVGVGVCEVQ